VTAPRYVLIANPGTKRCETYRAELDAYWRERGVTPDVTVVPWAEVVPRNGNLDDLPAFDRPALVRLESPGKCDDVTRLLLEVGARDDPREPPFDWRSLPLPKGLLVRPGLLHRGFARVLRGLKHSFNARPHLRPTVCPLDVINMFEKTVTAKRIHRRGVPVPNAYQAASLFDTASSLIGAMNQTGWPVVYVKLNTGSSATGIVVLHTTLGGADLFGLTTLARIGGAFYNSRLVRRVTGEELDAAVQFIIDEGANIQRGIPMAQIDGQNFDVRVVCVYGEPVATIFRISPNPMTNLHLGGRRGDYARCRAHIPTRRWLDALDHCAEAAACFDSAVAGVDLLFERGYGNHYVLEVNAFGDFFPGWTDARGRSIHAIEIDATANRVGG
jgi:hypothetical protein